MEFCTIFKGDVFTLDSFHLICVCSWSFAIKQQLELNLREKSKKGETFLLLVFVYSYYQWAVSNVREDDLNLKHHLRWWKSSSRIFR